MIKRNCKHCGREYNTYPSINLFFCSKRCSNKWREGKTWYEIYDTAKDMYKKAKGKRKSKKTEFKKGWQYSEKGKEILEKRRKSLSSGLNKIEKLAVRIFNENNIPFQFVGEGDLIIGGKNPDFVYTDNGKKIIEIYGTYWHKEKVQYWHQTEEGAKIYYELFGYNCLVIWEDELKNPENIIKKVNEFINTTIEIEDIPIESLELFNELCEQECKGNKGFALKFLLDFYLGRVPNGYDELDAKIDDIESEMNDLRVEDKKPTMLVSGEELKLGG